MIKTLKTVLLSTIVALAACGGGSGAPKQITNADEYKALKKDLTAAKKKVKVLQSDFVKQLDVESLTPYAAFMGVIERDARDAQAAVHLVLVQPSISSQLVDNLNASIHLRALLTDLFLIDEVLKAYRRR